MTDPNFYFETERLYISYFLPSSPAHCEFLVTLYNSPEFMAAQGKTGIDSPEKARARFEKSFIPDHARNGYGQYLVSLKTTPETAFADARPIGSVSLMRGASPESFTVPDIGYAIIPEMCGKGYATEAARGLLDYAKKELGVPEVLGVFDPANYTSRRVMEKLGFQDRGLHVLPPFGGVRGAVYALPGKDDLQKYGIPE